MMAERQWIHVTEWYRRQSVQKVLGDYLTYIFALVGCFFFTLPFWWMVSTSLKTNAEIFKFPPTWLPDPIVWSNYPKGLTYMPFALYFKNTIYVAAMTLLGTLISAPLSAYSFARLKWPGRNLIFFLILSTMMLPPQVTMIPLYFIFSKWKWINTFKPLYIRAFFGPPYFIFLLRQYFMTIPSSLDDAARIDGCTPYGIYWRIMLPLVKPALVTVAIFVALNSWNDFIYPLLYLQTPKMYTLAIALQAFRGQYEVEWGYLMAVSVTMTIPVILLFFILQRYFIRGIVLTGLKG